MADTTTSARTDLAEAITEILVDLHPGDLSGDEIVDRLCASEKGTDALAAVGRELTSERIREAGRRLGDALTEVAEAFGYKRPVPVETAKREDAN